MKNFRNSLKGLIASLALLVSAASAANISIEQHVNLSTLGANPNVTFSSASPTSIQVGDVVTVTYVFDSVLPTYTASFGDGTFALGAWLYHAADSGYFTISDITTSLLSPVVAGVADTTLYASSETSGFAHLGPYSTFSVSNGSSLSFSGIQASFTVTALNVPSYSVVPYLNMYTSSLVYSTAATAEAPIVPSAVPEPSTYGILGAASLLGLASLRRRKTAKK